MNRPLDEAQLKSAVEMVDASLSDMVKSVGQNGSDAKRVRPKAPMRAELEPEVTSWMSRLAGIFVPKDVKAQIALSMAKAERQRGTAPVGTGANPLDAAKNADVAELAEQERLNQAFALRTGELQQHEGIPEFRDREPERVPGAVPLAVPGVTVPAVEVKPISPQVPDIVIHGLGYDLAAAVEASRDKNVATEQPQAMAPFIVETSQRPDLNLRTEDFAAMQAILNTQLSVGEEGVTPDPQSGEAVEPDTDEPPAPVTEQKPLAAQNVAAPTPFEQLKTYLDQQPAGAQEAAFAKSKAATDVAKGPMVVDPMLKAEQEAYFQKFAPQYADPVWAAQQKAEDAARQADQKAEQEAQLKAAADARDAAKKAVTNAEKAASKQTAETAGPVAAEGVAEAPRRAAHLEMTARMAGASAAVNTRPVMETPVAEPDVTVSAKASEPEHVSTVTWDDFHLKAEAKGEFVTPQTAGVVSRSTGIDVTAANLYGTTFQGMQQAPLAQQAPTQTVAEPEPVVGVRQGDVPDQDVLDREVYLSDWAAANRENVKRDFMGQQAREVKDYNDDLEDISRLIDVERLQAGLNGGMADVAERKASEERGMAFALANEGLLADLKGIADKKGPEFAPEQRQAEHPAEPKRGAEATNNALEAGLSSYGGIISGTLQRNEYGGMSVVPNAMQPMTPGMVETAMADHVGSADPVMAPSIPQDSMIELEDEHYDGHRTSFMLEEADMDAELEASGVEWDAARSDLESRAANLSVETEFYSELDAISADHLRAAFPER